MIADANIYFTDQGFLPQDYLNDNNRDAEFSQDKFMHFIQQTQERNVYIYR
jgi:hypothetical protein